MVQSLLNMKDWPLGRPGGSIWLREKGDSADAYNGGLKRFKPCPAKVRGKARGKLRGDVHGGFIEAPTLFLKRRARHLVLTNRIEALP